MRIRKDEAKRTEKEKEIVKMEEQEGEKRKSELQISEQHTYPIYLNALLTTTADQSVRNDKKKVANKIYIPKKREKG